MKNSGSGAKFKKNENTIFKYIGDTECFKDNPLYSQYIWQNYMADLDTYTKLIKSLKVDNLVYDRSLDEYPRLDKYGSRMIFPK